MNRLASPRSMRPCEGTAANEVAWVATGGCADRAEDRLLSGKVAAATGVRGARARGASLRALCAFFGAALGLVLWSGVAEAHGEAEWIRNMQLGCCGPTDCAQVPDGTWIRQQDGYLHSVTGEFITHAEAKASVDEHFWECRYGNGRIRSVIAREGGMCLFVPSIGF